MKVVSSGFLKKNKTEYNHKCNEKNHLLLAGDLVLKSLAVIVGHCL